MSKRIEERDSTDRPRHEDYSDESAAGQERLAQRREEGGGDGRVNEARSERGTRETRSHREVNRRPGSNDNLGSGRACSHKNAPGGGEARGTRQSRT